MDPYIEACGLWGEVLSPSNKRPGTEGWELYQRKRQSVLLGNVSLVEIDLLRGGRRMPMLDPWPDSPYTLLVARAKSPFCRVWRAHYRRPAPAIPVPLAKPDPDITLELQPMFDAIYQRFRYERSIDYKKPLTPPLAAADSTWLKQQLRASGGRPFIVALCSAKDPSLVERGPTFPDADSRSALSAIEAESRRGHPPVNRRIGLALGRVLARLRRDS
jgi:hypothetical protein